jgi:uncharacterized protein
MMLQILNISAFTVSAAQTSSISDARLVANGTEVTFEGVITAAVEAGGKTNLFVQDDNAAVIVRGANYNFNLGDKIKVTGSKNEYYDMTQVEADVANISVVQAGVGVPEAKVITSTELTKANGEAYEAMLVTVEDFKVSEADKYNNFTAADNSGTFVIRSTEGLVTVGKEYKSVTGVIDYNFGAYKVTPRTSSDVIESGNNSVLNSTISDARKATVGSEVSIEGTVTAGFEAGGKMNYYVQDATAGIIVRVAGLALTKGTKISVKGTLNSYYDMEQIEPKAEDVKILDENAGVPDATVVTSTNFDKTTGESVEGMLVKVENVKIDSVNKYGDYTGTDVNGQFTITPGKDVLEVGKTYDIIFGVVNYSYGKYRLMPRSKEDAVEDKNSVFTSKAAGDIVIGSTVELKTYADNAAIYYTLDGTMPTNLSTLYSAPIEISEDTTVKAIVVSSNGTSAVYEFNYVAIKAMSSLSIHDIQGAEHVSPYEGKSVTNIEGIVTYVTGNYGFFMQEPNPDNDDKTSEGIYVYLKNSGVKVGDLVSVNGLVKEYREKGYSDANDLLTTQIAASDVSIISSGNDIPEAVVIGVDGRVQPSVNIDNDGMKTFDPSEDGLDFYESLEGMLVTVKNPEVVAPPKYGEVAVVVDNGTDTLRTTSNGLLITPEDLNPERLLVFADVTVKVGDKFDGAITGVITYTYSNFKLQPTEDLPPVVEGDLEQETTTIQPTEDDLTVATYNVENFSAATDAEKVTKIAKSIINNLKNPDIIGLVEVQDNDGPNDSGITDASESYKTLINAIIANGGPTYAFADVAPEDKNDGGQPGGNIRVGFLYNVDRVSLVNKPNGNATTAVGVDANGSLTLNPGRIEPNSEAFENTRKSLAAEFDFNGEKVIVIVNHFNSKRGDDPLFGATQPALLGSETKRLKMANAVNGFVKQIMAANANANVVVLGDMNDFEFSNPLKALKGDILTNMIEELPQNERYTYVFQGNSQVLDHILVSNHLKANTEVDIVHLNAEFAEEHGRASDHDPIMIKVSFEKSGNELPNTATNIYNTMALGVFLLMLGAFLLYRKRNVA